MCDSIAQFGFRRVLIVTDAVLVKLGLVEPLRQALADRGIDVAVHDGITPDPTHDVLQRGYEAARAHGSEAILAVGGGSVIDAAKVIDAMMVSGKSPAQAGRHAQGRQADAAAVRRADHGGHRLGGDGGRGGDRSGAGTSRQR